MATITTNPTINPTNDPTNHPTSHSFDGPDKPDRRLFTAGIAGLTWLALLLVTNIMNGSVSPAADADVTDVLTHLTDHRAIITIVTGGFVIGIPCVFWFFSGLTSVLRRAGLTQVADTGMLAVTSILTMFGTAALTRLALMTAVETGPVDDSAIWTMWKLHDVAFNANQVAIGVALLAYGLGGVAAGLLPRWIKPLALVGATALIGNAVFLTVPFAEGSNAAMLPGLFGFILWMVFVGTAATRLVRLGSSTTDA